MSLKKTHTLSENEKYEIFQIWNKSYPKQIVYEDFGDFKKYLKNCHNPTHYLFKSDNQILGWLCVFDRDNARWFALIINPKNQRQGIGRSLLDEAKKQELILNGWIIATQGYFKSDGSAYISPREFYEKNNFYICEEVFKTEKMTTTKITWSKK